MGERGGDEEVRERKVRSGKGRGEKEKLRWIIRKKRGYTRKKRKA